MSPLLVDIARLRKDYFKGSHVVPVLQGIDLQVEKGRFIAVMGTSGSGKSTLLNIIGCLDRPTGGSYHFDGRDVLGASDDQLSTLRSRWIGFVFQNFNLIPTLTVFQNVALPFLYRHESAHEIDTRVKAAVEAVGLSRRSAHKPAELSGGELQRAAIARALAVRPKLILADEPTGNLDRKTGMEIMAIFKELHQQGGTIILVTHDAAVAAYADACVSLCDGRIEMPE